LSNSTDAQTIIAKGVDHKSPFACEIFKLIFLPDDNGAATSNAKFDTDDSRKHFWLTSFATLSVACLNQERNNLAMYVHTIVDCVLGFSPSGTKESKAELAAMFNCLPMNVYLRSAPEEVPADGGQINLYFEKCSALYAAAHFGRIDQEGWITFFMPIMVCMTKYRSRSQSSAFADDYPLSAKNKPNFSKVVDRIITNELVCKTISSLLRKAKPALEALVCLQVVKYIVSDVFKGYTDVLVNLLKSRQSLVEPPPVPSTHTSNQTEFFRDNYIAPISSSKLYSNLDISYFMDLREKVHDGEKNLDKKRSSPDDGSQLIYAFAPHSASALETSPERRN
jgi:hypothetical protein